MSDPNPATTAELRARLAAQEGKVAGLRASLSDRKRALLDRLAAGLPGAVPSQPADTVIGRRREAGPALLSFAQERLWFLDLLEPGQPALQPARGAAPRRPAGRGGAGAGASARSCAATRRCAPSS